MDVASGTPVPADDIRAELKRIATSPPFASSARLRRFLHYVVTESLNGEGDAIKEYAIGVTVYERGPAFDPRHDSIVRTEAARLRRKLAEYYAARGDHGPVRIHVPVGTYAPIFIESRTPGSRPCDGACATALQPTPARPTEEIAPYPAPHGYLLLAAVLVAVLGWLWMMAPGAV